MADNSKTFQSTTPATLPDGTIPASADATFSGDAITVPLGGLLKISGSEGARTVDVVP